MTTARHTPIPPKWRAVVGLCLVALGCAGILILGSWTHGSPPVAALSCGSSLSCGGAGNTGDGIDLWRGIVTPGDGGSAGGSVNAPGDDGHDWSRCSREAIPPPFCVRDPISAVPTPGEPERPNLSLFDLRHVTPRQPGLTTEPRGWSIVNLPTNVIGATDVQLMSTQVLGYDVDVMFTPEEFQWTYGDGASAAGAVPGDTWTHLGRGEFAWTPTAHAYRQSGRFMLGLTVGYSVLYRYAGESWRQLDGLVWAQAEPVWIVVERFDRALVGLR